MKQVMCINDKNQWWSHTSLLQTSGPQYGEICTVLDEVYEGNCFGYVLEDYRNEPFDAALFIPLSKPSLVIKEEMELMEELV